MIGVDWIVDLLATAREELRERIQPQLAPEDRYVAAMIGRAMQIAGRELALGAAMRERERQALAGLFDDPAGELEALRRQLVRAIREGAFDARRGELEAALAVRVAARLAITDPDYR